MAKVNTDGGRIVLGTYDGGVVGLRAETGEQTFGYAPHNGCVKTVHCSDIGRCATGGTDHSVRLFDIVKGMEIGELQEHTDTVSCVEYWGVTSLITAGNDGQVCVWRCSDWELLRKFRAHKDAISSVAVHPSGRMMASTARDNSLRLWDLTRGTSAAIVPLEESVETLLWSPSGDHIAALSPKTLYAVNMSQGGAMVSYQDPASSGLMRINLSAAMFLRDGEILVGDGKGDLRVLQIGKSGIVETFRLPADAERVRVKALARMSSAGGESKKGTVVQFSVATSSGRVEIWSLKLPAPAAALESSHFERLRVVDTGARVTCMSFWSGARPAAPAAVRTPSDSKPEKKADIKAEAKTGSSAAKAVKTTGAAKDAEAEGGERKTKKRRKQA